MQNFKVWFNEVAQEDLDNISSAIENNPSSRFVISTNSNNDIIEQFIKLFKSTTGIILKKDQIKSGLVPVKVMTNQGEKTRETSIGNLLKKNKNEKLFDMWSVVKDKIQHIKDDEEYSVIISKNPIDILRMSDHCHEDGKSIKSCHSPGNDYFSSAIQEAKTGGAIAYAVKLSDLNKINLNDKEIFKDKDRNVDGIVPLERLRLRKFIDNKGNELLIPELRVYSAQKTNFGEKVKVKGFAEAVDKWCKDYQAETISKIEKEYGSLGKAYDKFYLKGGSYQDNDADELWNKFFGTNVYGEKKSIDRDSNGLSPKTWLERAGRLLENHKKNWEHKDNIKCEFNAIEADEGESVSDWNFEVTWEIEMDFGSDWMKKANEIKKDGDLARAINGYFRIQDYILNHFEFQIYENMIDITGRFEMKMSDLDSLDEFENNLDSIDTLDGDYLSLVDEFKTRLIKRGYVTYDKSLDSIIKDNGIKHFHLDFNANQYGNVNYHYLIVSEPIILGDINKLPVAAGLNSVEIQYGMIKFSQEILSKNGMTRLPGNIILSLPKNKTTPQQFNHDIRNGLIPFETPTPIQANFVFGLYLTSNDTAKQIMIEKLQSVDNNWNAERTKLIGWYNHFVQAVQKEKDKILHEK